VNSHNTRRTGFRVLRNRSTRPGECRGSGRAEFLFTYSLIDFTVPKQRGGLSLDLFDVDTLEKAEAQIDAFIDKRAKERADANNLEEFWAEQDRRIREKRRPANRRAWIAHHGRMNLLHLGLAAEHADKRSRLMLEGGYEVDETPDPEEVA